jgi:hypothetical protein
LYFSASKQIGCRDKNQEIERGWSHMNYITERRSSTLSNEPYKITYGDIKMMYNENLKDMIECKEVTESSNRGESYYTADNKPGEKMAISSRHSLKKLYTEIQRLVDL